MSDQAIAERVELDKKDKTELATIVSALGGKPNARMKKSDLIDAILELSGVTVGGQLDRAEEPMDQLFPPAAAGADGGTEPVENSSEDADLPADVHEDSVADNERDVDGIDAGSVRPEPSGAPAPAVDDQGVRFAQPSSAPGGDQQSRSRRRRGRGRNDEPPAEWELEVAGSDAQPQNRQDQNRTEPNRQDQNRQDQNRQDQNRQDQNRQDQHRGQQNRSDQNRQERPDQNRQDRPDQSRQERPTRAARSGRTRTGRISQPIRGTGLTPKTSGTGPRARTARRPIVVDVAAGADVTAKTSSSRPTPSPSPPAATSICATRATVSCGSTGTCRRGTMSTCR